MLAASTGTRLKPLLFKGFRSAACGFAVYQSHRLLLKSRIEIVLNLSARQAAFLWEFTSSLGHPGGSKSLFSSPKDFPKCGDEGSIVSSEERPEFRSGLEERNRIEQLQSGREGIGERPHRARGEFRVGRLEVISMNIPSESARDAEFAFDKRPIYHQLRLLIRDLTGLPGFDLLTERIEIALNPVDADRQRIHDREVLRMLENRGERA